MGKMNELFKTNYHSPIGILEIASTKDAITSILFDQELEETKYKLPLILKDCVKQLDEYFSSKRMIFELNLEPAGTDFQKKVWRELIHIPYGITCSYKDLAMKTGSPLNTRAVGNANGRNPISIIIPCHRVIGANGKLIGYGGGLWRKKWLLQHEMKARIFNEGLFKAP
jgi:methylated-DNA-[protein]-cysteine S-methyltransferase